jgi:hypothetical protein
MKQTEIEGEYFMRNQKRIRDYGISIGKMTPGPLNSITDIKGIKVGHVTLNDGLENLLVIGKDGHIRYSLKEFIGDII